MAIYEWKLGLKENGLDAVDDPDIINDNYRYVSLTNGLCTFEENGKLWDEQYRSAYETTIGDMVSVEELKGGKRLILMTVPRIVSDIIRSQSEVEAMIKLATDIKISPTDKSLIKCIYHGLFDNEQNKDLYLGLLNYEYECGRIKGEDLKLLLKNIEDALKKRESYLKEFPEDRDSHKPSFYLNGYPFQSVPKELNFKTRITVHYDSMRMYYEHNIDFHYSFEVVKHNQNVSDKTIIEFIKDKIFIKYKENFNEEFLSSPDSGDVILCSDFNDVKDLFEVKHIHLKECDTSGRILPITFINYFDLTKEDKVKYEKTKTRVEEFIEKYRNKETAKQKNDN